MDNNFDNQVSLLLRILPEVIRVKNFALKGGTAINMFVRDMPRLSVDIDLTYVPVESREVSLKNINRSLEDLSSAIENSFSDVQTKLKRTPTSDIKQINVQDRNATIKVEINHVLRGVVNPCIELGLSRKAQDRFRTYSKALCLSFEDLYAGKFCAALDRQHPRDLFDVKVLLENEGFSHRLRKTFIVYLISNNRPIAELINPNRLDIAELFQKEFAGMMEGDVTYDELIDVRETFIELIASSFTKDERHFLISFKEGQPNWNLLGLNNIESMPAIQWKLMNIKKMNPEKHLSSLNILKCKLGL